MQGDWRPALFRKDLCRAFSFMDLTKALNLNAVTRFNGEMNGEKFWFDAKEEMITPLFVERLENWDKNPRACAEALAEIITDWDVEEDGKKVEITAERLARVPKKFHNYCINLIIESWQGDPTPPSE
jgi:hypothetical protein